MHKDRQLVLGKHIKRGIDKYKGIENNSIQKHIDNLDLNYKVYQFADFRILLVFSTGLYALLYKSKEALFDSLDKYKIDGTL